MKPSTTMKDDCKLGKKMGYNCAHLVAYVLSNFLKALQQTKTKNITVSKAAQ